MTQPGVPMTADNVAIVINALAKGFPKRRIVNEQGDDIRIAEAWVIYDGEEEHMLTTYAEPKPEELEEYRAKGWRVEKVLEIS